MNRPTSPVLLLLAFACILVAFRPIPVMDPPFSGTIFIDPDIITSADPSTFQNVTYAGRGMRQMYDRRVNNWIQNNAILFMAKFDDGLEIEVQVNSEFGNENAASVEATTYALEVGRLPNALRKDVQTMWIHKGVQPFGGGNHNILIHTGQAANYIADGILEETLVHEASHTSLDAGHASAAGWLAAQTADPEFISTYARDNPTREDVAESFLTYLAVRHRADRISPTLKNTIEQAIPNRIAYFDSIHLNLYPITTATNLEKINEVPSGIILYQNYPNPLQNGTTISFDLEKPSAVSLRITNLLGQEITTLSKPFVEAGNHQFEWDGRGRDGSPVSNGTYIYQIEIPVSRITKSLTVVH